MVAMKDQSGTACAVGRLTGWEPLGFEAGDNNWYRFVANGPAGATDPSGKRQIRGPGGFTRPDECPKRHECTEEEIKRDTQAWLQCVTIVINTYDAAVTSVIADRDERLQLNATDELRLMNACAKNKDPLLVAACQIGVHAAAGTAEGAIWTAFTLKVGALAAARTLEIHVCARLYPCASQK